MLETTEGTKGAARGSMSWINNFAAQTPLNLDQVTESFVKLRAYGLDPTNGLLNTLGDTSSSIQKSLEQVVEAMADAVTGENECLKEFGIKANSDGNTITYTYNTKDGAQHSLNVDENDRKAIQETLSQIFNEKFAGSMVRLSKTWVGMVSNITEQWIRFKNSVMQGKVFDFMKEKLGGFLDKLNQLAANGKLREYAENIANSLIKAMQSI